MAHHEICTAVRDQTGAVLPLQAISVWTDAAASTAATLYDSATATAAGTNPATTDANGLLHVWCDEPTLWYTTTTQLTALRLPVMEVENSFNVRDYGAIGDGTTDDTQAFLDALDAARTQERATYDILDGWHRCLVWPIIIPPGQYKVRTGELKVDFKGCILRGSGRHNTWIITDDDYDDDVMIEIGYYAHSSDPWTDYPVSTAWYGSRAQGCDIYDLSIIRLASDGWWDSRTVQRGGVGIQDNGAGNVTTWNVTIRGFSTGMKCPSGHDFGYHYNLQIQCCDIGLYLAFGSEQAQFYGLDLGLCNENLVLESCLNVMFYGINTSTPVQNTNCTREAHDITMIGHYNTDDTSVYGEAVSGWSGCRAISFYNLWEERAFDRSDDGGLFREASAISSYIRFEGSNCPQQVQFYDPIISYKEWDGEGLTGDRCWMSFGDGKEAIADLYHMSGATVNIYNPWFAQHNALTSVLDWDDRPHLSYWQLRLENPMYSGQDQSYLPPWLDWGSGGEPPVGTIISYRNLPSYVGTVEMAHAYNNRLNLIHHNKYGMQLDASSGTMLDIASVAAGGTATRAFRFIASGNQLCFGDCSSTRQHGIRYDTGPPGSGDYVLGDIIFNSEPASAEYAGWICVSAGNPGTWKGFGTIAT